MTGRQAFLALGTLYLAAAAVAVNDGALPLAGVFGAVATVLYALAVLASRPNQDVVGRFLSQRSTKPADCSKNEQKDAKTPGRKMPRRTTGNHNRLGQHGK